MYHKCAQNVYFTVGHRENVFRSNCIMSKLHAEGSSPLFNCNAARSDETRGRPEISAASAPSARAMQPRSTGASRHTRFNVV